MGRPRLSAAERSAEITKNNGYDIDGTLASRPGVIAAQYSRWTLDKIRRRAYSFAQQPVGRHFVATARGAYAMLDPRGLQVFDAVYCMYGLQMFRVEDGHFVDHSGYDIFGRDGKIRRELTQSTSSLPDGTKIDYPISSTEFFGVQELANEAVNRYANEINVMRREDSAQSDSTKEPQLLKGRQNVTVAIDDARTGVHALAPFQWRYPGGHNIVFESKPADLKAEILSQNQGFKILFDSSTVTPLEISWAFQKLRTEEHIDLNVDVFSGGKHAEGVRFGLNKGFAVDSFREHFNAVPSSIRFFGDSANDMGAFLASAEAVVMANHNLTEKELAMLHRARVKVVYTSRPNTAQGVAHYLREVTGVSPSLRPTGVVPSPADLGRAPSNPYRWEPGRRKSMSHRPGTRRGRT